MGYIDEDYERVYGIEVRKTLYLENDLEYSALRASIMSAPRMEYDKARLPFDDFPVMVEGTNTNKLHSVPTDRICLDELFPKFMCPDVYKLEKRISPKGNIKSELIHSGQSDSKDNREALGQVIGSLLGCNNSLHSILVALNLVYRDGSFP